MKDWERTKQPLENPKCYLIQQEITRHLNEAVTASVGMLLLQQIWTAGVPAQWHSAWVVTAQCDHCKARHNSFPEVSLPGWANPAIPGSGTATQVLNSKESSPLPFEVETLNPFAVLTVARFVPQSRQSGCTELSWWESSFASSSNKCYMEKKVKKGRLYPQAEGWRVPLAPWKSTGEQSLTKEVLRLQGRD